MFQTKRALREKINQLERELSEMQTISAFIDNAPLPKCRNFSCVGCEHIIYRRYRNRLFVLGCGKSLECPDFQQAERSAETQQLLQEDLLSQQSL